VLEQINKIEIASADALKRLREEREVLEGRIKAMDDMKGDVQEAVYLRVRSDYSQRVQQLHEQARPLLEEARKQYSELRVILDKLQGDIDSVNLDRQELELRHKLGEFDAKEFQKQLKAIEGAAGEKQQWHEQARQLCCGVRCIAKAGPERHFPGQRQPVPPGPRSYRVRRAPAANSGVEYGSIS